LIGRASKFQPRQAFVCRRRCDHREKLFVTPYRGVYTRIVTAWSALDYIRTLHSLHQENPEEKKQQKNPMTSDAASSTVQWIADKRETAPSPFDWFNIARDDRITYINQRTMDFSKDQ